MDDLERWAGILIDHSLGGISRGERVMLKGEAECWPLLAVLERKVISAGGVPDVCLVPPNNFRGRVWSASMVNGMRPGDFDEDPPVVPDWYRQRYESMDAYVEVMGYSDPLQFNRLVPRQSARLAKADKPFMDIRVKKRWVLTLYPTAADAQSEGFSSLEEYAQFLAKASITNPDWVKGAADRLAPVFQQAKDMTIRTRMPGRQDVLVLRVGLGNTRVVKCCGQYNWPDGEVFRSPDPRLTEGEIYLDLPVCHGGQTMQGIYLKFANGSVCEYSAVEGEDALRSIIETDAGSRRLGEVALGLHTGLTRVLKNPLYVEKVGGTLHIALGQSYEECYEDPAVARLDGSFNDSARHVDLVADFRTGRTGDRVILDNVHLFGRSDGSWGTASDAT